ncbi:hypothetical protein pipiens_007249 [Culex pipiens pipiens]|uniref:Roadkill n=1 Tax=Culex pipiens pipiens TaxID=38569 RepID=A0ABD1DLY4_CULPP
MKKPIEIKFGKAIGDHLVYFDCKNKKKFNYLRSRTMSELNNVSVHEEKSVTSVRSSQYDYTWEINNYSVWSTMVGGAQYSPVFPSGQDEPIQWQLKFEPKSSQKPAFASLFVELVVPILEEDEKFVASFEITLENFDGTTIVEKSCKGDEWNQGWGWYSLVEREKLRHAVMPTDKLIIRCKIFANTLIVTNTIKENLKKLPEPLPSSLSKDYNTLVDGQKFGDVTILIDDHRFLAYKGILAARSAVFAAMFEHQMQETLENCVTISDVEPNVFKELLRYIYTDELSSLGTMAHSLYTAADKYAMPTLKSRCRCHILEKLNWETAAETLVLAEMHSDQEMKKHALRFLSGSEAGKVTESGGWKNMVRTHPYLVDEMVKALAACRIAEAE